ncbi:MAG: D-alanine--D-alanine ligase [Gammaproteobacteria bacterium]|nr:MAG: D-alanine--D-alanine ligase [Gammaproteobacteria bacterium]
MDLKKSLIRYEPRQFGRVAVFYGGASAEREISLQTGSAILAALQRRGVDAFGIDTADDFLPLLQRDGCDRAFIALHGRGGEDGTMQGLLELLGIPYTGSGVLGSALAMDKQRSKWIWQSHGLPTPPFVVLSDEQTLEDAAKRLGFPLMVKPVHEGSSCGIAKVKSPEFLHEAWLAARSYDAEVIAERWIAGGEYTVSILNGQALPIIRVETDREFYDYQAKYLDDTTRYLCPCGLDPALEQALGRQALSAFRLLGAGGWGRVDLLLDGDSQPWFIDVNTIPGMTSHSLVPKSAHQAGIDFDELVMQILAGSMQERPGARRERP